MERFGNDRPDLRYGMELKDVADIAAQTEFKVFQLAKEAGHRIRGLCAPGGGERYSRKDLDGLTEFAGDVRHARGWSGSRSRPSASPGRPPSSSRPQPQAALRERFDAKPGDLILIVADTQAVTSQALTNLRTRLATELNLYDPKSFHYSWVVRFPLLAWDAEEGRYVAEHHPFTMPLAEDLPVARHRPGEGPRPGLRPRHQRRGMRRRHDPYPRLDDPVQGLRAAGSHARAGRGEIRLPAQRLANGAPPHGGIAFGFDRLVMLYAGLTNIRDCIAFPKTAQGTDLMTGAPGTVDARQLRDLHVKIHE